MLTKRWITAWAESYPAEYDEPIAHLAGKRQPKYADIEAAVRWKSARSLGYFKRNNRAMVERQVRRALAMRDPLEALDSLTQLRGVGERVGSAILAVFRPNQYTVMDARAWKSLRSHRRLAALDGSSWRRSWAPYLKECQALARKSEVSLRQLDRALYKADGDTGLP